MTDDHFRLIQGIYYIVISLGGVIAASNVIIQLKQNREQRKKELRWRQANVAKEILDDLFSHPQAQDAVLILDWSDRNREYEIKKKTNQTISYNEVINALNKNDKSDLTDKEVFIVDCFDWFFYLIDRIEHYIDNRLITFEDVNAPLKRYADKIRVDKEDKYKIYKEFMEKNNYNMAVKFFERFKLR